MRCPQDFGLVTLDDYPWLRLFRSVNRHGITQVRVGCMATELLIDRIEGKSKSALTHKIAPHLCVRESCGFGMRNGSANLNAAAGLPALVTKARRRAQ